MHRRGFLGGLLALAAPAIIRTPGLLMPVKQFDSGMRLLTNCGVWEALHPFGLPPLKQEGALVAFDNPGPWRFEGETYLQMRQRFSRVIREGVSPWRGNYAEV